MVKTVSGNLKKFSLECRRKSSTLCDWIEKNREILILSLKIQSIIKIKLQRDEIIDIFRRVEENFRRFCRGNKIEMKLIKIYFGYDLWFEPLLLGDLSSKFQIVTLLEITKKFHFHPSHPVINSLKFIDAVYLYNVVEFIPRYENST